MRFRCGTIACATSLTTLLLMGFVSGCHDPAVADAGATRSDGVASQAVTLSTGRPRAVLIVDQNRGDADVAALAAFRSVSVGQTQLAPVVLELDTSRNRALAAPFHALDGPTLVCISAAGVNVSRDEGALDAALIRQRFEQLAANGPALDRELAQLQARDRPESNPSSRRRAVADFLLAHHNDAQAISYLQQIADDTEADLTTRTAAWVALGRAHLWIVEPEKARHSAEALIETLEWRFPEAIAGGNLIRGLQDTRAKRFDRAREEFNTAIAAAPDSPYGREAADLLTKLPTGKVSP